MYQLKGRKQKKKAPSGDWDGRMLLYAGQNKKQA
jgi:hypothetical protein